MREYIYLYRSAGLEGGPCTQADVEQLEKAQAIKLPAAYKAYLLIAGNSPPRAWVGSDCTIRWLPHLREGADELLRENQQPALPENSFVFFMHQGYQFFYFTPDATDDDPAVYYYLEGGPPAAKKFDRFSELMALVAADGKAA